MTHKRAINEQLQRLLRLQGVCDRPLMSYAIIYWYL
ncbi:hypothetical protein D2E25_1228 [Bifidobacterium goeldii]|uniref:Uncharacterized protein n=1 Tax=Bifidobacterium goeldii TaxID=2306975 RepID=A0A430FK21_9BIFI|nr:hypothetical protein D2E25_1228 [Bifidobacterium goeldii]